MLKREGLRSGLWIFGGVLLLLLAIGSLWDLQISELLYHTGSGSAAARFFGTFGKLPGFLTVGAAGAMLAAIRNEESTGKRCLCLFAGLGIILVSGALGYKELAEDAAVLGIGRLTMLLIFAVCFLAACAVGYLLGRKGEREDCFRFVLTAVVVCFGGTAITEVLKHLWGRPRMWFLQTDARAVFAPWWQVSGTQKETFLALGVGKDAFRSFPSGHTTLAAGSLVWMLAGTLHRRLEGRGRLFFCVSAAWIAATMVTRVVMGRHFVTDVTVACLIDYVLLLLSVLLFYRENFLYRALKKWVL